MFFSVLLFHPFFVIIHNAEVCARAAYAAADTDSRFNRVNTLEKTEQKSGGRGPTGIVKRIFGSFRDGSAEEVFRHPANDYIASFLGLNDIVWKDDGSVLKVIRHGEKG